jgi:hypothetical protein
MKLFVKFAGRILPAAGMVAGVFCVPAAAQSPMTPIIVDTAVPIIINAVKPKPKNVGLTKFEGFILNANIAQVTLRAKDDERSIQTFTLSQNASAKMQQVIDKGGYQWGDKVTLFYDPANRQVMNFKGKPSKPI